MSDDLRPATAVVVGGVVGMLVANVVLQVKGFAPQTHVWRTPPGKIFLTTFALHVIDCLGPADPFRATAWAASRLPDWTFRGARIP